MSIKKPPTWNLSSLYQNIKDPQIQNDLARLNSEARKFQQTYRKSINRITISSLKKALRSYTNILQNITRIEAFAFLNHSINTADPETGAFLQLISTRTTHLVSNLIFFEIEISQLPNRKLESFIKDTKLSPYRHFLEKLQQQKPHRLSSEEESILLKKSLTGNQAFLRLYKEKSASQLYPFNKEGQKELITISKLQSFSRHPNRQTRKKAAQTRHRIHTGDPHKHAFTFNTLIQDWGINSNLRNFNQPEDARHLENEITRPIVDTLTKTVVQNYSLVHEYYQLKKRLLNLKKLHDYDKYAPVSTSENTFSFPQAKTIILESFQNFSPLFSQTADLFFQHRWIHAAPGKNKQAGAYCLYGTPDTNPFIMLNYHGTQDDVSIMAHELGHGVHAYLARQQNMLHFDWPITIAETASVFGEMLVFDNLKTQIKKPDQKLSLYVSKIDSIFSTVSRQIAVFLFERKAHELRNTQGELTAQQLNNLWVKEQKAMFGASLTMTESEQTYWQIIPHIFQSPFYVYAYAFGELLTLALYHIYQENRQAFVPKYFNLLSAGGSKSPQELLDPFGVNLANPTFWQKGLDQIAGLIQETENIAKDL